MPIIAMLVPPFLDPLAEKLAEHINQQNQLAAQRCKENEVCQGIVAKVEHADLHAKVTHKLWLSTQA